MKKYKEAFLITPKGLIVSIEHRIDYMSKHPYTETDLFYNGFLYTLWYKTREKCEKNKIGTLLIKEFGIEKINACVRGNCVLVKHAVSYTGADEKQIIRMAILNEKMDKTIRLFSI